MIYNKKLTLRWVFLMERRVYIILSVYVHGYCHQLYNYILPLIHADFTVESVVSIEGCT